MPASPPEFVSVIIPVYNGERFIADTVNAVLRQSRAPDEIVIVNDGSSDGTLARLAPFGDAIRVISIPNGGVSNARNTGIAASRGSIIAFLDADDLWEPNKLEVQLAGLAAFPEVGFTCCNFNNVHADTHVVVPHLAYLKANPHLRLDMPMPAPLLALINSNFVGTCSNVLVRRSVLDATGPFDTGYRQSEDYDLWLRCAMRTPFLFTSQPLMSKVAHDTNLTNNFVETLQYHEKILEHLLTLPQIRQDPALVREVGVALARTRYHMGELRFNDGDVGSCMRYFRSALAAQRTPKNLLKFLNVTARKSIRLALRSLGVRLPARQGN